ncbi:PREDICTED: flavonol synthase/flavanone 3-hydroxylase [Ipomoea nil]|uniref:flavonol synthase/flavanone 3-hydroxylase n=1 Tax=Ipomoea nil TaxID=35883 RepID=UPI0009009631|nr:PREDICTED: flavonol synthase/flavanone 3-hydroxylase [Ipomoea nil]
MAAAVTPESFPTDPRVLDFRAPPPSPIASGRRSCVANDEVLTHFLESSLKVPDLVLPDRVFPRQKLAQSPPKLDFRSLESMDTDSALQILDSVASIGCFQVINHGIPSDLIQSVLSAGGAVFRIPREMKATATRSPEKLWGFEEVHAEDDREASEEFVWCKDDQIFNKQMEGIWPLGYSNFREKMEKLSSEVGYISGKILEFLEKKMSNRSRLPLLFQEHKHEEEEGAGSSSVCYLHKQWRNGDGNSLKYDVIRVLIRGCEFPHALCVHFTNGSSAFNLYSRKDWVSFQPHADALIFTIGDRLQACSGGRYKHVIGREMFEEGEEKEDCISMAILYSPPEIKIKKEKTISFAQQIIIAVLFIIVYQFLSFIFKKI